MSADNITSALSSGKQHPSGTGDVGDKTLKKVANRLIPYMFSLYILSYLDRINVSFAGLQMYTDLKMRDEDFGFGLAIFFIGYFLFGAPGNIAMEKIGARRWISAIMVVWGFITMALALANSIHSFYVLRFFLGAAEAGFFPGMILYLTYWFPEKQRGVAVAKFMAAIPAAGVLGGLISSKILEMGGILGLPGWKWLFLITGLPSVLMGVVTLFFLTDRPESAKWLSSEEKTWLKNEVEKDRAKSAAEKGTQKLFDRHTTGTLILLSLLYFSLTLGMYGFQLWLPKIIKGFGGLTDGQTALVTVLPAIFQAVGMIVIAKSSERTGERRLHVATSATIAALGFVLTSMIDNPWMSLVTLSITAFGIWGTVGPFWSLGTSLLPARVKAAGIGFVNSTGNLGGFVGPYIVGAIKQSTGSFHYGLYTMACSLVLAGLLSFFSEKLLRKGT
ncbi:MAG TPA: MFS transporter, partial [Candidatus Melainabacteria bacterium]|nr:MFS transporter [Candidatus Melainabacteria bacterium]